MTSPASPLTLMAVHAHPDDESSSTGGVLARYSGEGIRTVVVTCTNGEYGDAPGGIKPGSDGHDSQTVARLRLGELAKACEILGVAELETLGFHDSGMPDWEYKDRLEAFCNVPLEEVAAQIGALIERYRPDVLVTHDPDGPYQHPDHVHAAWAALAAASAAGIPAKVYLTAMRGSDWQKVRDALAEAGEDVGPREVTEDMRRQMAELEARITTSVDIHGVLERKREALLAHGSQIAESWFSKIPPEVAEVAFGREHFIRVADSTGAPVPEDDLLAGLRVG